MVTLAEIKQRELLLAIYRLLREDIEAQFQPEIKDSNVEWEEERNAFDFMENLYYLVFLLFRCNRSSFRT